LVYTTEIDTARIVKMKTSFQYPKNTALPISFIWLAFGALFIYFHSYKAGMTLHYLSVAWEMYKNHLYLSTYINGSLDFEKTPLLYWLIVGGWRIRLVRRFDINQRLLLAFLFSKHSF
jgi:4-amino-4-deoxy-L-arabinose transferase-like glycosyltransferase